MSMRNTLNRDGQLPRRGPVRHSPPEPLDPDRFAKPRLFFQVVGPMVLIAGVVCMTLGFLSMTKDMGNFGSGPPKLVFLLALGIPLMFVGLVLSGLGYKRWFAQYTTSELSSVASQTVNYLGDTTQEGVRAIGQALREGIQEAPREGSRESPGVGMESGKSPLAFCPSCGSRLVADARFCHRCGASAHHP